jgi:hypothetical protein
METNSRCQRSEAPPLGLGLRCRSDGGLDVVRPHAAAGDQPTLPAGARGRAVGTVLARRGSGRPDGICARQGSHTTGRAVFRIRRLVTSRGLFREVRWCDQPISLEHAVVEGFLHHGASPHAPGPTTAVGYFSSRWRDAQSGEGGSASSGTVPALPKAFPHVAAYPAAQFQNASPFLGPAIEPNAVRQPAAGCPAGGERSDSNAHQPR